MSAITTIDAVRLPDDIEEGAQGGPGFKTSILQLGSGFEKRNVNWSRQRCEFDISYGIMTKTDFDVVLKFFMERRGMARGFLFRDWVDYQLTDELIGTGNAATTDFQLTRTYGTTAPFIRKLTRPDIATLVVKLNGVVTAAWTHLGAGLIRFTVAPGVGVLITVTCEFDVPSRFTTDKLGTEIVYVDAMSLPAIGVVELRE